MMMLDKASQRAYAISYMKEHRPNLDYALKRLNELIKDYKIIAIYYPLDFEIDLLKLLDNKNKIFCFPKVENKNMNFYNDDINEFKKSKFNIKEPLGKNLIKKEDIELFIIPSLAVFKDNKRLGYGMGYYDRYLEKNNAYKVSVVYKDLVFNTGSNLYDIKIDEVILCTPQ
jgi:5-formyltetrahydrofolate cyclo-ligase